MTLRHRLYEVFESPRSDDKLSRNFDIFIVTLIALNVLAVVLETVNSLNIRFKPFFKGFEIFSVAVFTVEYIGRVWSAAENPQVDSSLKKRLRFAVSPLAIIDLLAIAPFYLPLLIPFDLRFIRALRLLRIFRLFKLGRYSAELKVFARVLRSKKEELVITAFVGFLLLVMASSLMFFIEKQAQPEAFSSIPKAMWWGVTTLTTVGYGDVYPVTASGKILASLISVIGIGLFALPAGILGSGFYDEMAKRRSETSRCPHCGGEL